MTATVDRAVNRLGPPSFGLLSVKAGECGSPPHDQQTPPPAAQRGALSIIWMGLLTNSYFYKKFDRSRARVLFWQSLLMLGGLGDQRLLLQTDGAASRRPTGERRAAKTPAQVEEPD